jgi:6-pyruvoyltetrahydropterin/6-carboxytetrahydropterin synthase
LYSLEIRDHVMIAHSFVGEVFGPAQKLHGATYVIDVCFFRPELDRHDIVVDIGLAHEVIKEVLGRINYQNLDEHPDFNGRRSTTEAVARWVFEEVRKAMKAGKLGPDALPSTGGGIERIKITLHESHVARASYEGKV